MEVSYVDQPWHHTLNQLLHLSPAAETQKTPQYIPPSSYLGWGGIPVPQAFGAPWIKKTGEFCAAASHQAAWFPCQAEEKQTREPQQHQAL